MFGKIKILCLSCFRAIRRAIRAATTRLFMCAAWVLMTATLVVALWGLMRLGIIAWAVLSAITVADVIVVVLFTAAVYTAVRVLWFMLAVSLEMAISSVESVSTPVESVKFQD